MKRPILIFLLAVASARIMAQGNFSPYSQFGIGDLEDNYYNRTAGMSNTGIAYRSNRYLINNNPASFTSLADQYFSMETGVRGSLVNYYGKPVNPQSTQSGDITFRRLAMGIKPSKHWGTSIGLVPFSTQNYEFDQPYYLQGSSTEIANHYFQGHGSLNKVYWSNAYEFFHHLSLGIEGSYLFGQLNQKDILQNPSNGASLVSTTNTIDLSNLYVVYGMQAYGRIGKKWNYSIGGTFSNKTDLLASYDKVVQGPDSSILQNPVLPQNYLTLPYTYGGGLSVTYNQKYTFVADFKYQDWSSVAAKNTYPGKGYTLGPAYRGSTGFEISRQRSFYNNRVELSYFQAGLYYGDTYVQVNGQQIKDMGATMAFGINSLKSPLAYSIVFQYGIKGTTKNDLVRQNYANITFVINYGSIWYTKGKKYD